MRIKSGLALVVTLLLFSAPAFAAEMKIGLINLATVVVQCDAGKDAAKKMNDQFSAEKKQLEAQDANLKKKATELEAQRAALSAEAREDKQVEFMRLKRDLEDKSRLFVRKVEAAEMRVRQDIGSVVMKAVNDYGKKNGYTFIMDGTAAGVMYTDGGVDITNDIIKETNRVWKENPKGIPPVQSAPKK